MQILIYRLLNGCLCIFALLFACQATAANYVFTNTATGNTLPAGCAWNAGSSAYICTSRFTLTTGDTMSFTGTGTTNVTLNAGAYETSGAIVTIGSPSQATTVNITSNADINFDGSANIYANLSTSNAGIYLEQGNLVMVGNISGATEINIKGSVTGTVTSSGGEIHIYGYSTISSTVSCATCAMYIMEAGSKFLGAVSVGELVDSFGTSSVNNTVYKSSITTLTGSAELGYYGSVTGNISAYDSVVIHDGAKVTGNVSSNNDITIGQYATVTGNISTTDSAWTLSNIIVYPFATVNGNVSITTTGSNTVAKFEIFHDATLNGSVSTHSSYQSYIVVYQGGVINGNVSGFANGVSDVYIDFLNININYIRTRVVGNVYSISNTAQAGDLYFFNNTPGANDATIYGSVYVSGDINNYGVITGCAQTSNTAPGHNIYLYSTSRTNSVCSGTTSCSTNPSYLYLEWAVYTPPLCTLGATKIANYALDETSWNGTANETKETAGYAGGPFNGQGIGTPVPTADYSNPAIAGTSTGTCGYATFSGASVGGSSFRLTGLPVSTAASDKTSVSFWMYWSGADSQMPIGWWKYNLFFVGGAFGFNTDNSDVYGISSAGLANGWHHVVAVFTNGSVASNKLYIDGSLKSLSAMSSNPPLLANAVVQSSLQVSGYTYFSAWRFTGGRIDEVKVYNGEMSQAQVTADYTVTHSCPIYNIAPSSFNCTVVGGTSNTGHLYTQVAGSSFSVDVVALKASGAVETSYVGSGTKNVTLEFVDGSGSSSCASRSALSPAISQTVSFAVANAGRKTVSGINIAKAYRDLRCRVTDANQTPNVVGCSSDDFAVRPSSFTVTSGNANADSAGVSTTATPTIKTGANFNLTAATGIVGYDGTPSIDSSKLGAHTGAIQTGTLSGSFGAANSSTGSATGSSFTYSEVGYLKLAANGVYDSTFTAVDSANGDCNTGFDASGSLNACSFGNTSATNYFGRFIPDHFAVSLTSTTPACGGSFTYFGQDGLSTAFTLTAQNSSNVITKNYTGGFAKLGLTTWDSYKFTAATLPTGSTLSASSTTAPTGTWSNGSASIVAKHQLSRSTLASAPTSIIISAAPVDSDGVTMPITAVSASSSFKYGRLYIPNTYGSELLSLPVPIEAQYWNGTAYQRNQQDSCSVIPISSVAMGNYKNNLSACEAQLSGGGTMSNGQVAVKLSAPGSGNNGSVDLSLNLSTASGSTCAPTSMSATSAAIPWFGSNPNARETFGLYKSPVIYMRENFY